METKRQELLRNATDMVRRGGSASLNFRGLGHSVGVKSSTVHYYFPTKSDLLNEIAGDYRNGFIEALDDGVRRSKSFRQDMLVLVNLFVAAQEQKLSCLCGMLATETELLDRTVNSAVNQFFVGLQAWVIGRSKRRAIPAPAGLAPATFAKVVVSLLEGALLLSPLDAHKSSLAAAKEWVQKAL